MDLSKLSFNRLFPVLGFGECVCMCVWVAFLLVATTLLTSLSVRKAAMARLCAFAILLAAASTLGHKGPPDTYHVSVGHLLLLKCPIVGEKGNVTWTRKEASAGPVPSLPPGVEVRDGFLYFLPAQMSHNGSYSCQRTVQNKTFKIDFGVLVSPGQCPPVAEERSISLGVTQSLPCKLDHVLRRNDTTNIRWLKDCRLVEREGAVISRQDSGLRLSRATEEDAGTYTCLVDISLDSRMYTSARSVQLHINKALAQTFLIEPEAVQQQNQVLTVIMGARVELKCLALVGYSRNEETSMFWIVNGSFAEEDPELNESFHFTSKQGHVFGESNLTILRVLPRFLNVSIHCRIQSPLVVKDCLVVQLVEANHSWFYTGVAVGVASSLLLLIFLLVFFKVDVVLTYRNLHGYFVSPQDADPLPYDALVSVVPTAGSEMRSSVASDFALQILPGRLEERHGYRLFISGRDDSPGEATHDAMAATMRQCRRLIIIVVSAKETDKELEVEKKEAKEWQPFRLEDRQLSYEQKLGLHDALMHNAPTVILLEIDGPPDYSCLPQSLAYIKRRQGALTWRKNRANRFFWKKLRFLMPAVPASRQSRSRQNHIL